MEKKAEKGILVPQSCKLLKGCLFLPCKVHLKVEFCREKKLWLALAECTVELSALCSELKCCFGQQPHNNNNINQPQLA